MTHGENPPRFFFYLYFLLFTFPLLLKSSPGEPDPMDHMVCATRIVQENSPSRQESWEHYPVSASYPGHQPPGGILMLEKAAIGF
ncbi:hypothetical protein BJX96DRAFT_149136 [Aspergillus floccosus]